MKKIICLLLVLILSSIMVSMAFAVPDTVESAVYGEDIEEIEDNDTPAAGVGGEVEIIEEEIPLASPELPKTGGIPAEAFYIASAIIISVAAFLLIKKPKTQENND